MSRDPAESIRLRSILIRFTACACVTATALAADVHVDDDNQTGTEDGSDRFPYRTLTQAVGAAADGDQILVAAGEYNESVRIESRSLVIRGGYAGATSAVYASGAGDFSASDPASNESHVRGPGGNAVFNLLTSTVTLDGLRITAGTGSTEELPFARHGGGVYCREGTVRITFCTMESNSTVAGDDFDAESRGGGVYSLDAALTVTGCTIRGNTAGRGAGVFVSGGSANIESNTVENNVGVGDHGGGLFLAAPTVLVASNVIRGNEVGRALGYGWGGGMIVVGVGTNATCSFNTLTDNFSASFGAEFVDEGATALLEHELLYGNTTTANCGSEAASAIYVDGGEGVGSTVTVRHCTVTGNLCDGSVRGNGIQVEGLSNVTVVNSIFWNNSGDDFAVDGTSTLQVNYCCSQEGYAGTGNISDDPQFVNAATSDYRLLATSPCIDAGDPASDFTAEPAPNGGRADMGVYGNTALATPAADSGSDNGNDNGNTNDNSGSDNGNTNDNSGSDGANDNSGGSDNGNDNPDGDDNTNENSGGDDSANENSGGSGNTNENPDGNENNNSGGANNGNDNSGGVGSGSATCPTASTAALVLLSLGLLGRRRRDA